MLIELLSALFGAVVGWLTSWYYYRRGVRESIASNLQLVEEFKKALREDGVEEELLNRAGHKIQIGDKIRVSKFELARMKRAGKFFIIK